MNRCLVILLFAFILGLFSCSSGKSSFLVKRKYNTGYYFSNKNRIKNNIESIEKINLVQSKDISTKDDLIINQTLLASTQNNPNIEFSKVASISFHTAKKKSVEGSEVISNSIKPKTKIQFQQKMNPSVLNQTSKQKNKDSFWGIKNGLLMLIFGLTTIISTMGLMFLLFSFGDPNSILLGLTLLAIGFLLSALALRMGSTAGFINGY